ncbi:hypothetical protein [Rhodanobacter lindaniclasticus]
MIGATRNHAAIVEVLQLIDDDMQADGGGLCPNHRAEAEGWALLVDCYAVDEPTAPDVWMAIHCIMALTRTAADAESLRVLRDWLTPGYRGHSTAQMVQRSMAWSREASSNRQTVLEVLADLADDVEREAAGRDDESDVLAELEEVRAELVELKAERMQPSLSLFDWVLHPTAPMREFGRAVASFVRLYPMRSADPLDSLEKVTAARGAIAKRVRP